MLVNNLLLVCNTIRTVTTHIVERITPKCIKNMYMLEKNLAVAKNVGNVLVTTKRLKDT